MESRTAFPAAGAYRRARTDAGRPPLALTLRRCALCLAPGLVAWSCAASPPPSPSVQALPDVSRADVDRVHTSAFAKIEDEALAWLAAADPRLARRAHVTAPEEVMRRIGTEAVLEEDPAAQFRGGSLDLFAFRARARAIEKARRLLTSFRDPLPDVGPVGSTLRRPELERELLARLVDEERVRVADEEHLGNSSGELVRGIVSTWTPPETPRDWPERDAWVHKHLLEIRDSLRDEGPRVGPSDLDVALYPLERLLAPLRFPRGSAAIALVRMALDEDTRGAPSVGPAERVARAAKAHLGMTVVDAGLPRRLERLEARLRAVALETMGSGDARRAVEKRARELLFVESACPAIREAPVRAMAPPPERAAICGAVSALAETASRDAALVALHDEVLFSLAALAEAPRLRTGLLSQPENDVVDAMERAVRERPVIALGVAFAAELLYGEDGAEGRLEIWRALGDAPLDVVAREINAPSAVARLADPR